jgi:DivIVA domain-containing protein
MDPLSSKITMRAFTTVKRGYDPNEVDAYLRDVAARVASIEDELSRAHTKVVGLEKRVQGDRDADTVVQTAFLAAAEAKAKLLQEARARADEIIASAEARAGAEMGDPGATVTAARAEAERMLAEAQRHVEALEADIARRRQEAEAEIAAMVADARAAGGGMDRGALVAIDDEIDEAREKLHRIVWLLRTLKEAVRGGIDPAETTVPELQVVLDGVTADLTPLLPESYRTAG